MIVDNLLEWIETTILWMISIFPDKPDISAATGSFSQMVGYVNGTLFPMSDLLSAVAIVMSVWTAMRVFALINYIVNKVRGSGG